MDMSKPADWASYNIVQKRDWMIKKKLAERANAEASSRSYDASQNPVASTSNAPAPEQQAERSPQIEISGPDLPEEHAHAPPHPTNTESNDAQPVLNSEPTEQDQAAKLPEAPNKVVSSKITPRPVSLPSNLYKQPNVRSSPSANANQPASTKTLPSLVTHRATNAASSISSIYSDRRNQNEARGTIVPRSTLATKRRHVGSDEEGHDPPSRRTSAASVVTTSTTPTQSTMSRELPSWYSTVVINARTKARLDRSMVAMLNTIRDLIGDLKKPSALDQSVRSTLWERVREQVHKVSHQLVDEVLVKSCRLLESNGLPQLFVARLGGTFPDCPFDISADSRELFLKWCRKDFDPDILRGIKHAGPVWTIIPGYPMLSSNYFGEGDLVSGQWWPRWVCMRRDGGHGEAMAGIHGKKGQGAMSVVMAGGGDYEDIDDGEVIQYCGTEGFRGQMTEATQLLRTSIQTRKPVRVMRSAKIPEQNPYRPILGVRYDGLYTVESEELLNPSKAHYRFRMVRVPDQDPIRCRGSAARPYPQEIDAFRSHMSLVQGSY